MVAFHRRHPHDMETHSRRPPKLSKHSKCKLSFMGVSDFKIFMFKYSENKAQMNEKVPTLHKSSYVEMMM